MNARWVRGPPAPESTGDGDYSNEVDRCEAPVRRSGADGVTGGTDRRGRPRPRPGRRMRATVCKVCNPARRARPSYGVQAVPFRARPGLPRDAPDGVQGVQCGASGTPPIRCARCAISGAARTSAGCAPRCARCAMRRAGPIPPMVCKVCHFRCGPDCRGMRPTVCKVCHSARRTRLPYGVQAVPFRVRPGPPRDAPHGVQGVPFDAPGRDWRPATGDRPQCARCASRRTGKSAGAAGAATLERETLGSGRVTRSRPTERDSAPFGPAPGRRRHGTAPPSPRLPRRRTRPAAGGCSVDDWRERPGRRR